MRTCNKNSTPQLATYATKMQPISIYLAVNVTFKYITDARSYRHANKYTCVNCTSTDLVHLSSDGVDVMINDIKEHLVDVETINNLLREENQHLRRENIQNKNNLKVEKTNNANNVKDLEIKIKKMQTELSKANRKLAENIKEINRLKHHINKDTDINGKPNTINVSINEDINIMRNNGNDERFIDEFVDFKKFVTVKFQNINQEIANLYKRSISTSKHSE